MEPGVYGLMLRMAVLEFCNLVFQFELFQLPSTDLAVVAAWSRQFLLYLTFQGSMFFGKLYEMCS